ncbi:exodeoxyribonuclease VII large subunit [Marivirga arenosa]|uniref:Exodeoxyribonuclease 7 large subunit n=1 Tax=Marivirga arenosa TaxID=3059076 RepID=A0AA51ZVH1_9BACT|nr:exodeoxyribonuclease VII large subunit [Marivirga sp. BKB1-2]WNB17491.1 exodeoxyribonuclease VII large subunit [Marivirga sp. BKB1-2]
MQHISLTDLNLLIKETLNTQLEPSYWVVAEIGELREARNGHCYLEFIEKDEESNQLLSKIRGTIWSYSYRNISAWFQSITGENLKAGMTVLANVQIQFHEVYGLSLNVKDIDPNFTLGERARKKQEIIHQLQEDGVFDMNKSHPLPLVPQRIAIISAESAAGYGDFMNQILSNDYHYQLHAQLFVATMQGDKAAKTIVSALHQINEQIEDFDAVIIIRGGGAQVDLDCFDNYELASHVAQFPIPVFTGIGHERDETICDLVAHTKLKTPTAVAEFLIRGMRIYEEKLNTATQNILANLSQKVEREQHKLNDRRHSLRYSLKKHFNKAENQLSHYQQKLKFDIKRSFSKENQKLDIYQKTLELINPEAVFKKGYSYTSLNGKSIVGQKVKKGDLLKTTTANQEIQSTVQEVKEKKK